MKKKVSTLLFILAPAMIFGQHTFSIVAIDSITKEVGSAGATCGDALMWPGTPGAVLISDIIPGLGAIHTQSYWNEQNQDHAHEKLVEGYTAEEIINWLIYNDAEDNPSVRQYGAITLINESIKSSAFTGENCFDYKNHILGENYAIQGNILLGQSILDSMESRFLNTPGSLSDKLMASLQGAKVIGADTRCYDDQVSSLSAFLRVANSDDSPNDLYIDIIVEATPDFIDPIDVIQEEFYNLNLSIEDYSIRNSEPQLLCIIDILGREVSNRKTGQLLFYVYDNGIVEKKIAK
tara:strand:- start:1001 stop:1879 length:879 start_codon:yes stop_codon:yes gene_type:complete